MKEVSLFIYRYRKNERETLTESEESKLRASASEFVALSRAERQALRDKKKLISVEE